MGRVKSEIEQDMFTFVLNQQMEDRGVLDEEEGFERQEQCAMIASKYEDWYFNSKSNTRHTLSYAIVRRRNSMYKLLLDMILGDEAFILERYIYHCIEEYIDPSPSILDAKINFND